MKSRPIKFCCLLITMALLLQMLPVQVLGMQHAETAQENLLSEQITKDDLAEASLAEASIVEEIVEKRTQFSKEFLLSNGLCLAVVYPEAVHYEKNNAWEEIDNTLKAVGTGENGIFTNTAGAWQVTFPQQIGTEKAVTITRDGYTLSFSLAGELSVANNDDVVPITLGRIIELPKTQFTIDSGNGSSAVVEDIDLSALRESMEHPEIFVDTVFSQLKYNNVYGNTDITYDLNSKEVKESIVIEAYDPDLYGYQYTLNTGTMVPVLRDDGSIALYSPDGSEIVMTMPAPYMIDSVGVTNYDVEVTLEKKGSAYALTYHMPMDWLAERERVWPVVLDPVVVATSTAPNILDRTIMENYTLGYTYPYLYVGYERSNGKMWSYLQYVDLPDLSSGDVIVNASVSLYWNDGKTVGTDIEVHKVNGTWNSTDITWANKPAHDPLVEDYAHVNGAGRYYWDVTDIARGWYENENTGLMFKATEDVESGNVNNWQNFYSIDFSQYATEWLPYLSIVYRNSSGLESYWDYTANSAGRAGTGYVHNYTGNLVWVRGDIGFGGNRMPVSISHIYNADDSKHNRYGMGYGWKTNFNQTVSSVGNSMNAPYVWEDGDGTDHYFVFDDTTETYKDEDGLGLTLTVTNTGITITDKYDNSSYFDAKGRLIKQENYQQTRSSIDITYTDTNSLRIAQITDGAGRPYYFIYNSNNMLEMITYYGKLTTEVSRVSFTYSGNQLHSIIDKDGGVSTFSYIEGNLLSEVQDVDGYRLVYTYTTSSPKRVASISEYQGPGTDKPGGSIAITYTHNQTTFVDHNNNVQIMQFNDWGNTISIQDGEGRAQFAQYNMNKYGETGDKQNQLKLSSKLQNTVGNLLYENSFENANLWGSNSTELSIVATNEESYLGYSSLKAVVTTENTYYGAFSPSFDLAPGETVTFSAYVKNPDAPAHIALHHNDGVDFYTFEGETLPASDEWVRTEVTYTNTFDYTVRACAYLFTPQPGSYYIDCVQVEKAATASRFNLVNNGDFRNGFYGWVDNSGAIVDVGSSAAPELDSNAHKIEGAPLAEKYLSQTIKQSGSMGDCYVFAGWAKGNAIPLTDDSRKFGLKLIFNNTDDSTTEAYVSFNPDLPAEGNWQYVSAAAVADKAYTSITIKILYNHGANTVWFDGIQLYKETFGSSYTYDKDGNVKTVVDLQKQTTTYEYDTNNNLTSILQDNKAKVTYTYDDYHNVKTATTEEGLVYTFEYDQWGNNTSVTIEDSTGAKITSSAIYANEGNILSSTTNALDKTTYYGYNIDTNVLEWVQYPEDTEATRTVYTYDEMCRLASAVASVDSGYSLNAAYEYEDDLLKKLTTNSTIYNFTYGDFAQRSSIDIGNWRLANYSYTADRNRYLDKLTYGNEDFVAYTYDDQGRVIAETFENGDTVTYAYDNSGALATVTDSATGIKTSYYYDLTDRMMKYVETDGTNTHSVGYEYDLLNNLTMLVETINGVKHTTSYEYDDDNRLTSVLATLGSNSASKNYKYDPLGRVEFYKTFYNGEEVISEIFGYNTCTTTEGILQTGQISSVAYVFGSTNATYSYTYDGNGNITSISDGTNVTTYAYDSANQLIRENNQAIGKTWTWTYDNAGNIQSRSEYAYTAGTLGEALNTVLYTYDDDDWRDLLTGYAGAAIRYDSIGNPVWDGTWEYTWGHGRELQSMFRVLTEGSGNGGLQVETDPTVVKNGLYLDSDGEIRYYIDGTATYMGLIYVNGYYYYIRSSGVAVRNANYWPTATNGLMESATYHFDEFGRMTNPPDGSYVATSSGTGMRVDYTYDANGMRKTKTVTTGTLASTPRDGLHWDEDGELRYYVNGYVTEVGLIYVDGHYYYVKSGGTAVRNRDYWPTYNNGLLPSQMYTFNEYGWLIDPDTEGEIEAEMSANRVVSDSPVYDWVVDPENSTSVTYVYTYNGGSLTQMTVCEDTLIFAYDGAGKPMAVTWNGTTYLYLTNIQGDVIAILDTDGNIVVQYTYDAWGNILTTTGTLAETLGVINPLTYRGYVYDQETSLYYLQSRYYNPTFGRFINADALVATGQGLLGNNMFAYCNNTPVVNTDPTGTICATFLGDNHIFTSMMLTSGGGGYDFGRAPSVGASHARELIQRQKNSVANDDAQLVFEHLEKYGMAFYKGVPVFQASFKGDGGGASFGIIILDDYYHGDQLGIDVLNHEYGHILHMNDVGPVAYFFTTAIPSLTFAGLKSAGIIDVHYHSLPWEYVADRYGNVNWPGYTDWAEWQGSAFWLYTMIVSDVIGGVFGCVNVP